MGGSRSAAGATPRATEDRPPLRGPLRRNPANPRYFADDAGRAVYLTGSHTWAVMQDMWLEGQPRRTMDYAGFLDLLEAHGHTYLRFWQRIHPKNGPWSRTQTTLFDPQPWVRSGPGLANDGLPKFDLTSWNEAYFVRLRERVVAAGRRGLYVGVMFFEGGGIRGSGSDPHTWPYHPLHPENNVNGITDDPTLKHGPGVGRAQDLFSLNCPQLLAWQKAFVQRVVDTVNDLDHVLYEIANELPNRPPALAWQEHLCAFVQEYERARPKQHPVGITAQVPDQDTEALLATGADWISPGAGRRFEYRYNPPPADGRKVILSDTDHLWGHGAEVAWIWKSFTRGMNVLFMDPWEPVPEDQPGWVQGGVSLNRRHYHLWDAVRRNLGDARRYAARMDLNRSLPHGERCTSTYCLADPGREYLCYFPAGGQEGLDLWDAPGTFTAEWFDPATGRAHAGGPLEGGRRHALGAPFPGPAVLFLTRQE